MHHCLDESTTLGRAVAMAIHETGFRTNAGRPTDEYEVQAGQRLPSWVATQTPTAKS